MKRYMFSALLASFALACGGDGDGNGGGTSVQMDDVNGLNANAANNAIFDILVQPVDADGDGADDADVAQLLVIVSDQADLCAQIEADPDAIEGAADVQAASILGFRGAALGDGANAYAVENLASDTPLLGVILGAVPGSTFVEGIVSVREGGVDKVSASGIGLNDFGQAGNATFNITELTAGASLSGTFTTTLAGDQADPATFDTDADGDGTNDFFGINAALTINIDGATFCDAILVAE